MALQYKENMGSRKVSRTRNSITGTRSFICYDDTDDPVSFLDAINYAGVNGIFLGDEYPYLPDVIAVGFTIDASTEKAHAWNIIWKYESPYVSGGGGGGGGGGTPPDDPDDNTIPPEEEEDDETDPDDNEGGIDEEEGDEGTEEEEVTEGEPIGTVDPQGNRYFTGVSVTTGLAIVDGYISGAYIGTGDSSGSEATGTVVHQGGQPISIPVPIADITLSKTVNSYSYNVGMLFTKAGYRNSGSFLGFGTGKVLFKGMSVQKTQIKQWDISYSFAYDHWAHMRQIPQRDTDGAILWNDELDYLPIFWSQPFPDKIGFGFAPT